MNLQAGYIVDGISSILRSNFSHESIFLESTTNKEILKLRGLLEVISNFSIKSNNDFDIDYNNIPKILSVQNNIITRGLPTRAPIFIEELFTRIGLSIKDESKPFEFKFDLNSRYKVDINYHNVFKKLHLVYPRLDIKKENYLGKLDSQLENKFLNNSHPVFKQILQSQRSIKSIVKNNFGNGWVDFSHTIPYLFHEVVKSPFKDVAYENIYKTQVFEVDGPHHFLKENIFYDALRDDLISESNGEVFRYCNCKSSAKSRHYIV